MQAKKPCISSRKAVKGMLPKNKLGAELFRNLNVVVGQSTNKELKTKTVNLNDLK
jgi:large subunit ribosomal protein L13